MLCIFSSDIKLFLDRARAIKMNFYKKRDNIFVPIRGESSECCVSSFCRGEENMDGGAHTETDWLLFYFIFGCSVKNCMRERALVSEGDVRERERRTYI